MDFKAKLRNPKVQQYALEVIFPIAGYFFWDWNLLIIVVFYLLDYLASHILFTRRLLFIKNYKNEKLFWLIPSSIIIFVSLFGLVLFFLDKVFDKMYFENADGYISELIIFTKDELWFLFPVILLSYYMMDKMFFYMPRRFVNHKSKAYFVKNVIANSIATIIILIAALVLINFVISDLVIIFSIIGVKLLFDFVVKKRLLKIDI